MTTPRRRWSFSLRTLFVVVTVLAILLGWVGYQLNWLRQRHDALVDEQNQIFEIDTPSDMVDPPWPLLWFGEERMCRTLVGNGLTDVQAKRIRSLFPECRFQNQPFEFQPDPFGPSEDSAPARVDQP